MFVYGQILCKRNRPRPKRDNLSVKNALRGLLDSSASERARCFEEFLSRNQCIVRAGLFLAVMPVGQVDVAVAWKPVERRS